MLARRWNLTHPGWAKSAFGKDSSMPLIEAQRAFHEEMEKLKGRSGRIFNNKLRRYGG